MGFVEAAVGSDHNPLILNTAFPMGKVGKPFKSFWTTDASLSSRRLGRNNVKDLRWIRLIPFINDIITEQQSVFIPGRQSQDNIIILYEVFHLLKHERVGPKASMALKLDPNKAYDRICWNFLLKSYTNGSSSDAEPIVRQGSGIHCDLASGEADIFDGANQLVASTKRDDTEIHAKDSTKALADVGANTIGVKLPYLKNGAAEIIPDLESESDDIRFSRIHSRNWFLALSMAVSFQDALASTCPHFVEVLRVHRSRIGNEFGAVYYRRSSNDTVVRVGESTSRSTHNLQYTADVPFIKKYSILFKLGEQFEWKKARDFEDWLSSIVNARPSSGYYTRRVRSIYFVPPDAVVITHSCAQFFHVKLKNDELTVGWDRVAFAHNLGGNYILMFGLVGHLQFDLFVFDEEEGDDQDDLQHLLAQAPSSKKQSLDEIAGQTSAPIPKAPTTAMQNAELTDTFTPEVQALTATMEANGTTEASNSHTVEDTIAASKNPKKHHSLKIKND
ncbi:hypothetical protein RHSIM_Rhsim02G0019200 [Rhododendron simsii]|uniref:Reverse transcriptase domain-containing protein n=1 Tax=Rhododendron simsii TaxID=118357 RepID=A0A834HBI4_RHOSS|nr:hypothetical protein RHSIM_Rhsim02G0019200 [Rhododendron simsii]